MKKWKNFLWPYFEYYNDGYTLKIDDKIMPASTQFWNDMCKKAKNVVIEMTDEQKAEIAKKIGQPSAKQFGRTIVPKKVLKKLFPENIDNQGFWKTLDDGYKLLAVTGAKVKDEHTANIANNSFAYTQGALTAVATKIQDTLNSGKNLKILEIGYGFGAFAEWLHLNCAKKPRIEYFGIDIDKRIDRFANLYENDGWKIPKEIPRDLDIVYSMNVFQHLSQKQRFNYLKKAFKRLNDDGIMVFSSFIMTEENKDSWVWGLKDDKGRGYCHFFNQPTEVDYDDELKKELERIGFEIETFKVQQDNHLFCVAIKRNRKITELDPYGEERWEDDTINVKQQTEL